jgi:hypothetical protein
MMMLAMAGALAADIIVPLVNAVNSGNMIGFVFDFKFDAVAYGNGIGTGEPINFENAFDAGLPWLACIISNIVPTAGTAVYGGDHLVIIAPCESKLIYYSPLK